MVYKTFKASNGVTIELDDAYFRNKTPEELARDRARMQRVVDDIVYKAAVRMAKEKAALEKGAAT